METERAEAIVLRCQPVTESSLLITWYTREFGKLKTLAKGARRPKSLLRGKIDLFYRDEILFIRSRRSDLHLLHDCYLESAHKELRKSVAELLAASYACELVETVTAAEDSVAGVFDLLDATLSMLENRCGPAVLIWFELHLLAAVGWRPQWANETGTPKLLKSLAATNSARVQRVKLSETQVHEARAWVWQFWDTHVGRSPRSRKRLAQQIRG